MVAILSAVVLPLASLPAAAVPPDCAAAAAFAEREQQLPVGILGAIGVVESRNHALAIDIDGKASVPADLPAAVEAVRSAAARGARFIDVGCFQVDLRWHPDAFADPSAAFDPLANARVAARFLAELGGAAGSWSTAIARYHSSLAAEGASYAIRVLNRWRGLPAADPPTYSDVRIVAFGMRVFGPGEGATGRSGLPMVVTP